ncbi:hypothetical protein QR680_010144 [Steinernema hermaphroditum]|uniref:F-box domain-containing protein n=1 Tax=Steinernema hermaphroditum TaxID=289476 RepID=A0AA39IMX3_9BILA|nr:hypothetical protein QR680_010144 [Steinernema hermaphroditum]
MDLLSHDLIDHLLQFLPRKDLETINKVACWRTELSNWQLLAEHHLEERYLLDIDVYIPEQNEPENAAKRMKLEEGAEIDDKNDKIQFSVRKRRFTGEPVGPWDFKKLQYASLRDVSISFYHWKVNGKHRSCDLQQLLSILSLSVATRADSNTRSSLCVRNGYRSISDSRDSTVVDLSLQVIQVVQKTFAKVDIRTTSNDVNLRMEDFMRDYINHEAFLEDLRFSCDGIRNQKISLEGIVTLFKKRRLTPLTVEIPFDSLTYRNIEEIVKHWNNSDGYVAGHKELRMVRDSWMGFESRTQHDYLPHPTKRSSLLQSTNYLKIVKFNPWHSPVTFDWIDALINDWKARAGMYLYGEQKYGPLVVKTSGDSLPLIAHPSNLVSIELRKYRSGYMVLAGTKIKKLRRYAVESFISEWMDGSGDFVVGQLRKITVGLSFNVWWSISRACQAFYVHRRANSRLKIQASRDYELYTMSVVPIDPETVKDWNLNLLFGAD